MKNETVSKHTPGPWKVSSCSDGRQIVTHSCGITFPIASVDNGLGKANGDDEARKNARLIASAPDMLKALKMAVEMFDEMSADDMAPLVRRSVRNLALGAIKSAEGRI